jgi:hypothetical protein
MTDLVSKQTRATIAYGLVAAFVVAALWQVFKTGDGTIVGDMKELALIAVSFYFGSKSNGGSDHALASKIVSAVRERE